MRVGGLYLPRVPVLGGSWTGVGVCGSPLSFDSDSTGGRSWEVRWWDVATSEASWGSRVVSVSTGPRIGRGTRGTEDGFIVLVTRGVSSVVLCGRSTVLCVSSRPSSSRLSTTGSVGRRHGLDPESVLCLCVKRSRRDGNGFLVPPNTPVTGRNTGCPGGPSFVRGA